MLLFLKLGKEKATSQGSNLRKVHSRITPSLNECLQAYKDGWNQEVTSDTGIILYSLTDVVLMKCGCEGGLNHSLPAEIVNSDH